MVGCREQQRDGLPVSVAMFVHGMYCKFGVLPVIECRDADTICFRTGTQSRTVESKGSVIIVSSETYLSAEHTTPMPYTPANVHDRVPLRESTSYFR